MARIREVCELSCRKNGETILDLYSSLLYGENYPRQDVEFWVKSKQDSEDLNEINMPSKKVFYLS